MTNPATPPSGKRTSRPWWLETKDERSFFYAGVSSLFSILFSAAKLTLFLLEPNLFLLANVLFSLGIGAAKGIAVASYRRSRRSADASGPTIREQYRASTVIGSVLMASSALYIALSLPLLTGTAVELTFEPIVAEILALIAFVELGVAIVGTVRTRHSKQPLVKSIRIVNLGSALVLIVLAQAAILSFASTEDAAWGVGISAVLFGGAALLGGLYLVVGSHVRGRRANVAEPRQ